jgi:HPr kinase/phosphorylase
VEGISLSIQEILDDAEYGLNLTLLAGGQGLKNRVFSSRIQKPGLALAGYTRHLHPARIQVLGNTEISYLEQGDERIANESIRQLCSFPISCSLLPKA